MAAPIRAATALASTRAGRRVVIGVITCIGLLIALAVTPLIAIPLAIAGSHATAELVDQATVPGAVGDWGYPLSGGYVKGRGFGHNPVVGCGFCSVNHKGYDMAQGCGSTIYAAGSGTVITAGNLGGWGNTVRIDHGDELVTLYGHMQWSSLRVAVGDNVTAGTPLGTEGNTGRSFGCHLHFEVQKSGTPVDPHPFMAALGLPLT